MKKYILIIFLIGINYAAPEYRKIILENDLKVILVSDEKYNKSSASMNVMVGSLSDPKEYQGLAHFLEHMLFLGTEKYPDVEDYGSFLKSNGGYSNAYTAEDHTNYHFEVYNDAFEGALDRFSQFFISPLFKKEYTEREMNAVHSEYQKNLEQDYWRMRQVKRNLYNSNHPANHFEIGTIETLSNVNRNVLLDFYKEYYSSNMMNLSILSNLDLDSLEKLARKYFSNINNIKKDRIKYPLNYLEEKNTLRLLKVEPVKDVKRLVLEFPTPSFYKYYESKPEQLIARLIGYEGEGSLQNLLRSKGLAMGVGAWGQNNTEDYGSLNLWVELTSEGFQNYEEVLSICFSYIELLKNAGYQSFIFDEAKILAELEEKYASKGEGAQIAVKMANNLAFYPIDQVERVEYIYDKENIDAYMELLSYIKPDNMLATLSGYGIETTNTEQWYSAKYSYEESDGELYNRIKNPKIISELKLPIENPFMPTSTDIIQNNDNKNISEIIYDIKGMKVYHSRDLEFNRPKAKLIYNIFINEDLMSLENYLLGQLYVAGINENLSTIYSATKLAGLEYQISHNMEGIKIEVSGYNSSIDELMNVIIKSIKNLSLDENIFSVIIDAKKRNLENKSLSDAYQIAQENLSLINFETAYSPDQQLSIIQSVSIEDVEKYWNLIFNNIFIEASAHGNISKRDVQKISIKLRNTFGYKSISKQDCFSSARLDLPYGTKVTNTISSEVNNSAYVSYYKIGENKPRDRAMAMLIRTYIGQPYYMELRTNQQLGYIVASGAFARDNYSAMYCIVQSDGYSPDEVEKRSIDFLSNSINELDNLSDVDLNVFKNAVREEINEKSTSIAQETNRRHILAHKFDNNFNRDNETLDALNEITIQDIKETLSFTLNQKTQRNVTILLYANQLEIPLGVKPTFDNLNYWKKEQSYK
mgnify:FL=1